MSSCEPDNLSANLLHHKNNVAWILTGLLIACASRVAVAAPVVELFTSQGCYSCPAADEFLADLIASDDELVALEFHVDYWDDLVYGSAGQWKDPFSSSDYTLRQRAYNQTALAGRPGVYTPQMVINGSTALVGSSRRAVHSALPANLPLVEVVARLQDDTLQLAVAADSNTAQRSATVWLAEYDVLQRTDVSHGENHGKVMLNHNVVRKLSSVARWQGDVLKLAVALPKDRDNYGCAVFIQQERPGPILGAANCALQ